MTGRTDTLENGHIEYQDALGTVRVPETAYFGPQTQRALDHFPISGLRLPDEFIRMLALIKRYAVEVNRDLGLMDTERTAAIQQAADEIIEGKFDDQFRVDVFQTGSGTSTHMNVNEVIAVRANEILTGAKNFKAPVHPNDHVNQGQSSNDVIPTATHLAALTAIKQRLAPALTKLARALRTKSEAFAGVRKIGRTHLQDAVPITLGNEFGAYARQMEMALERLGPMEGRLAELALGGTAVGSGLNTHPEFAGRVIARLSNRLGIEFREALDHFQAQASCDTAVETSGVLKTVAIGMAKIANDIRWLASGPRCGLGEINLPALQPGSSIMPGKVNPVIPEAVIQVAAQVLGNDATIAVGGLKGYFELNTMWPVVAYNLIQSVTILASAAEVFADLCVSGITANPETCAGNIEKSLALATHLAPRIGYDRAAEIARQAFAQGRTIREVALEENVLSGEELDRLLDS